MKDDGYGLYEAVGQDKTAETPEHDAEALVGEDSVVKKEYGKFDGGDGGIIEEFDGEDVLCGVRIVILSKWG